MVQGLMKAEMYRSLDKGQGDGNLPVQKNVLPRKGVGFSRIKCKLFLSSAVLLTSIFVFTGIGIYLNYKPRNTCPRGCITVHIIPYMKSSINQMTYGQDYIDENDADDGFDYVVNELEGDQRRRFTITEIYPFWKWWKNQNSSMKSTVREMIKEKRIEIAGGGWIVPDEAIIHYRQFIDQFTWGLRRLEEMAGRKISPDVAFLVDNRGHSKEIAFLLREMGFRGVMLGGISPMEQCYRRTHFKMEFLWSDGDIFGITHEKPNLFASILDERALVLTEYFFREKTFIDVKDIFKLVLCQSRSYGSNHVFVPIGEKHQFEKARNAFHVIESIMNLTRNNSKYKLKVVYSTPSNYLNAVIENGEHWWRSNGEFLPYFQGKSDYWTGYYSLGSSFKYYHRLADRFLQVLKQLITLSNESGNGFNNLRHVLALCQHHHVSTSVSGQRIALQFRKLLTESMEEGQNEINRILTKLTSKEKHNSKLRYESCLKLNVSHCSVTEGSEAFIVTVYNPLPQLVNQYVRVPVTGGGYLVRTSDGQSLTTQLVEIPIWKQSIPGRESNSRMELIFRATKIPALGFKSYYVSPINETKETGNKSTEKPGKMKINLVLDEFTGKLSGIERNGEIHPISQEFKFYSSWFSNHVVFKPENRSQSMRDEANGRVRLINRGELVTEYEQIIGESAMLLIRIYDDEDFVEFDWTVGNVPVSFFEAKEIVTTFTTNIRNGNSFGVDSNGRGFEKVAPPEVEKENVGDRITRSYRPINSRIGISDRDRQLHVFTDRVQGGTSPFQGQVEIMLHRKFPNLDVFTNREKSTERSNQIALGQHWVFIGSINDANLKSRIEEFSSRVGWEPWYFFANASGLSFDDWRTNLSTEFSGLKKQRTNSAKSNKNLRILTLEPYSEGVVLLRLENVGRDGSERLTINLQELFAGFLVISATEVSLTGNGLKERFDYESGFSSNPTADPSSFNGQLFRPNVFVYPSEIKTFLLTVQPLL